jgi:hypothetical protein
MVCSWNQWALFLRKLAGRKSKRHRLFLCFASNWPATFGWKSNPESTRAIGDVAQAWIQDQIDEDYAGELLFELERASMALRR